MKKLAYSFLIVFCCFAGNTKVYAQAIAVGFDSLQSVLKNQTTIKDRIRVLRELVDADPTFSLQKPEYVIQLLELNKQAKIIDSSPYQLLQKASQYAEAGQTSQALSATISAIHEFDKQHKIISPLLFNIRLYYNKLNDHEARLRFYEKQLEYYQINGPVENTASCYHGIGGYYFYKAQYNQAITNYLKGAEVYRKFSPRLYFNAMSVVAFNYASWGNDEKSLYYLKNIVQPLSKKWGGNDVNNWKSVYYRNLSNLSINKGNYQQAIAELNEGIKAYTDQKTNTGINAILLVDKAMIYLKLGDTKSALPLLERATAIRDSGKYPIFTTQGPLEADYGFYEYYRQTSDNVKAEKFLHKANRKAEEEKANEVHLKYLKALSDFYEYTKQPLLALQYDHQYFKLLGIVNQDQSKYKVAQYEIDQKDRQQQYHINALKQEKAIQDYQLSRRNTLLWTSLVILLLISGLSIFIYRQLRVNKKILFSLRKTQRQLIMSEKMASLGELTAGIAHEIQNPLNFVNNFSEVSVGLLQELKEEAEAGHNEDVIAIAGDLSQNLKKINHHGKRADFIVKGMLQHSRSMPGERQLTDINLLADEFLKLSYHGLRAKDNSFNAEMITNFGPNLPKIQVVQQDIGRVLLNLFNNAFYAVKQKAKTAGPDYRPEVMVTTSTENGWLTVNVKDNGTGIPDAIKEKIMQPFFTTKPTGEGTGLGLSLTYDMVVKGHGGSIQVNSKEGEGSEFIIILPA